MTEDADSRTHDASEKKIRDALEKGQTPQAKELGAAALVLAFLLSAIFTMPAAGERLAGSLALALAASADFSLRGGGDAYHYGVVIASEAARALAPVLGLLMMFGLAAHAVQGAPRIVTSRVAPDLARLSPRAGLSRLASAANLVEFLKTCAKLMLVGFAASFAILADRSALFDAMREDPSQLPRLALRLCAHFASVLAIVVAILAAADFIYARFKWRKDLRMSRQELKEEHKEAEGDPFIKSKLRSLAMDRARRRMISSVPRASVVIANPTHFAIALRYVRGEGGAPLVVAKGKDLIALKIREVAAQHEIPIVERKELARALFDHVEVDRMIPPEFFRPVAEVINYLTTLAARRR